MDTTAAAELGMAAGAGTDSNGYWSSQGWSQQSYQPSQLAKQAGSEAPGVAPPVGYGNSPPGQGREPPLAAEPPQKKMRTAAEEPQSGYEYSAGKDYPTGNGSGGEQAPQTQQVPVSNDSYGASTGYWYGTGSGTDAGYAGATNGGWYTGYAPGTVPLGYGANPGMAANPSYGGIAPNMSYGGYSSGYVAPGTVNAYGASTAIGGVGMVNGRGSMFTSRMFYKTKLCTKFSMGACTFGARCNFAHGMEEIRKPPSGWEGVRFSQGNEGYGGSQASDGTQRGPPNKTRLCRIFYSEGTCPYGDNCSFLHDAQGLEPAPTKDASTIPASGGGVQAQGQIFGGQGTGRPPNWKTRICRRWETTGQCNFGENCHFAHGPSELKSLGRGTGGTYFGTGSYVAPYADATNVTGSNPLTTPELPAFESDKK